MTKQAWVIVILSIAVGVLATYLIMKALEEPVEPTSDVTNDSLLSVVRLQQDSINGYKAQVVFLEDLRQSMKEDFDKQRKKLLNEINNLSDSDLFIYWKRYAAERNLPPPTSRLYH